MSSPTPSPSEHKAAQNPLSTNPLSTNPLNTIRIVLVSPAGPLNVGSVARVMKNFGLHQLVLVSPQCDPLGAEALQMAVHAKDVLIAAQQVSTVPEALVGCRQAIATTARQRGFDAPLQHPETVFSQLFTKSEAIAKAAKNLDESSKASPGDIALIFGREDSGLSNEELSYAQQFIKVPTDDGYSALNLAQAVAICCYELHRASRQLSGVASADSALRATENQQEHKEIDRKALRSSPLSGKQTEPVLLNQASLDELERYYQHLEQVLLKVEYLYPHTKQSRMRKFRQLLHRATPTSGEVTMLRGILRQVEWAISNSNQH